MKNAVYPKEEEIPDDKTIRHPHDGKRIDVKDPGELRSWCEILDVNELALRLAVSAVGTSAEDVKNFLGKGSKTDKD